MRPAWRVADIRTAEAALMAVLPEGALMQRAAAGLARRCAVVLAQRYGGVYGRQVLVLAGPGDNGGDALYAGAALARRGAGVAVLPVVPDRVHAGGLAALRRAGGSVVAEVPAAVDLVIDGILGIGGKGGLRGRAVDVVGAIGALLGYDGARPSVIAVDLPSGIEVDTGDVSGVAVRADVTVTFGALKPGLVIGAGAVHSGLVDLVDIGLRPWLRGDPAVQVPDLADVAGWWPVPGPGDDKYSRGVVGLATGSATYSGAALLSVAGALPGPVGMVRYAGPAADLVRARHPSVICADRVGDAGRVQAWVCGCGIGTDERAATELRAVLAADVPVCIDADALNLLVDGGSGAYDRSGSAASDAALRPGVVYGQVSMATLLRQRSAPVVLTPHDREFARLAGEWPGADRVEAALRLAARTGAVVLLKGDRTVVATPDGRAYANPTGTAVLATGGTGDVLAGLLGSLLAAGLAPERAAVAAAYVHGLAGRLAAGGGPVTSADVAEALRTAVATVLRSPVAGGPQDGSLD